ncbi:Mut7-C RNAse domain-containing protein [Streptomyces violaceorubidus]
MAEQLKGGTQRSYDVFAQCTACGRAYWRGAHHEQLETIVERAVSSTRDA